jgi:hypothetical protein
VPKSDKSATAYPACKFTYIDKSGTVITNQRFDNARDFSEGLAPVRIGELWGLIDRAGSSVIPPKFEDAQPFSSDLSRIQRGGRYGYVDKYGEVVVRPQFQQADSFSDAQAVVGNGAGRYWYINPRAERSFVADFALASPFFKGLGHVELLSEGPAQHAYIDTRGRVVFRY